jgi:DNA mismatch endonuclease (patch repair protein)
MSDPLNPEERSVRMSKVRAEGNKSTEGRVEAGLDSAGISGWEKHPKDILGTPDFYFRDYKLAVFVDGCFWHSCPICNRRIPLTRVEYWRGKIEKNRLRDNQIRRKLRKQGIHVMRIWEHELRKKYKGRWLKRLNTMIRQITAKQNATP